MIDFITPQQTIDAYAKMKPCPEDGPGRVCYCQRCVAIMACRDLKRILESREA